MKNNLHERSVRTPAAVLAMLSGNAENILAATTPGGIEAQEKRGQMREAQRSTLPIDLGQRYGGSVADARKPWEALGFKFSNKTVDEIFVEVEFPKGWKKRPTDHSMWSEIVDEKGRKRGAIFYKAAFYDRSAHARLDRRFGVTQDYPEDRNALTCVRVTDACGVVYFKVSGLEQPDWSKRDEAKVRDDKIEEARRTCAAFLKQNFPDHESPAAYWE